MPPSYSLHCVYLQHFKLAVWSNVIRVCLLLASALLIRASVFRDQIRSDKEEPTSSFPVCDSEYREDRWIQTTLDPVFNARYYDHFWQNDIIPLVIRDSTLTKFEHMSRASVAVIEDNQGVGMPRHLYAVIIIRGGRETGRSNEGPASISHREGGRWISKEARTRNDARASKRSRVRCRARANGTSG